jgi:hypothetical protein
MSRLDREGRWEYGIGRTDMPVHFLILKGHNAFAIYEIGDDLGREPPTKQFCDLLAVWIQLRDVVPASQALDFRDKFRRYMSDHDCSALRQR